MSEGKRGLDGKRHGAAPAGAARHLIWATNSNSAALFGGTELRSLSNRQRMRFPPASYQGAAPHPRGRGDVGPGRAPVARVFDRDADAWRERVGDAPDLEPDLGRERIDGHAVHRFAGAGVRRITV